MTQARTSRPATASSHDLDRLRLQIDDCDARLVDLLAERFRIVEEVAEVKRVTGIPVVVPERIEEVVETGAARAAARGLDPDLARRVLRLLIDHAIAEENAILGSDTPKGTS